jgi:hypothetical protein
MQQSLFADQKVVMRKPDVIAPVNMSQASRLLAYGLPGAALLIALGVALSK